MDWFRWHHGACTDPKFQLIARQVGVPACAVIGLWAVLLEQASQASVRGVVGDLDFESIDVLLGLSDGQSKAIHGRMVERRLLEDGRICSWLKRQPQRERQDDSADRVRAHRAKKHQDDQSNATTSKVTPRNATKHPEEIRDLCGAATPTAPLSPTPPFSSSSDPAKPQDASDGTEAAPLISNPDPPDPDRASARASQPGNLVRQPHKADHADVRLPHNSAQGAAPLVLSAPDPPARKRPARKAKAAGLEQPGPVTGPTWEAYAAAYAERYGEAPVSNAKVNGQLASLIERLGAEEAPQVAAFYVSHPAAYYATRGHAVGPLLQDAEKLRTEWATGTRINPAQVRLNERAQANPFLELVREEAQGNE